MQHFGASYFVLIAKYGRVLKQRMRWAEHIAHSPSPKI
jgi:hypothetical protein